MRDNWAGIPMPLDGERLILDPRFPNAAELSSMGGRPRPELEKEDEDSTVKMRNCFYSMHKRCDIIVYEDHGRVKYVLSPAFHHIAQDLTTLGCSEAWGIEQEGNAVSLLTTLLSHRQFKQYMLTGMFLERSKRSGLTYMFRRLKPTVVVDARDEGSRKPCRILAALCMHPIGYYQGSWAGAMCPTDDVIAHLMLMRGDEHLFWRRANQFAPHRPEAGL